MIPIAAYPDPITGTVLVILVGARFCPVLVFLKPAAPVPNRKRHRLAFDMGMATKRAKEAESYGESNKRNYRGNRSCSDLLRNATTTPANPASATPTWAAVDKASPGSIAWIRTHLNDSNKHENEAGQLSRESVELANFNNESEGATGIGSDLEICSRLVQGSMSRCPNRRH